jgi:peptidoglycan-associated lipoprotein
MHKWLSAPFKNMKLAKFSYLLTLGLTLSFAVVGCKKGLDKTTQIPGNKYGAPSDSATPPRDIAQGNTINTAPRNTGAETGIDSTALRPKTDATNPQTDNLDNYIPNAEVFRNQTVYFDLDKSNVKASEIPKLEEVIRRMKSEFQGKALRIEGHCDERGTEEYNRSLGDRRALSVRDKFIELGLDVKIATITFGEEKPSDAGHTEAAWAKNRRAELILLSPP